MRATRSYHAMTGESSSFRTLVPAKTPLGLPSGRLHGKSLPSSINSNFPPTYPIKYRRFSELPAVAFSEEVIETYPKARIILSTRDVDAWYDSMSTTINPQINNYLQRLCQLFHPVLFQYTVFHKIYNYLFLGWFDKNRKAVYEVYNARIRGLVPKERLWEYHVSEGSEPLYKWLRKDIPDKEMPNGNTGPEFFAKIERIQKDWVKELLRNMGVFFGTSIAIGAIAGRYFWEGSLF